MRNRTSSIYITLISCMSLLPPVSICSLSSTSNTNPFSLKTNTDLTQAKDKTKKSNYGTNDNSNDNTNANTNAYT